MVSVIVPVYNGADRIIRCLESIQAQTYTDFECIVIDDGSTDGSYGLIENWISDDRFRLYHQENAGVAITRNRGIDYAKGEFIAFADQDDYVTPEYLEGMMSVMDDDTDIVVTGYRREDENGKPMFSVQLEEGTWSRFVVITPWTHLYRKSFIQSNKINYLPTNYGEDIYFNMMAYLRTDRVRILPGHCDYVWVYNTKSVSNTLQKRADKKTDPVALLDRLIHDAPEEWAVPRDDFEYYMIRFCVWYCLNVMRQSTVEENRRAQEEMFAWLDKHFPDYRNNQYLRRIPDGEKKKYHLAVKGYFLLKRTGLIIPVTDILSKRAE